MILAKSPFSTEETNKKRVMRNRNQLFGKILVESGGQRVSRVAPICSAPCSAEVRTRYKGTKLKWVARNTWIMRAPLVFWASGSEAWMQRCFNVEVLYVSSIPLPRTTLRAQNLPELDTVTSGGLEPSAEGQSCASSHFKNKTTKQTLTFICSASHPWMARLVSSGWLWSLSVVRKVMEQSGAVSPPINNKSNHPRDRKKTGKWRCA